MALHKFTEGWTGPLDFMLEADGSAVDLTGMTIALIVTDRTGAAVAIAGTVTPALPQTGTDKGRAIYAPHANDLLPGANDKVVSLAVSDAAGSISFFERRGRFRVTDGGGKIVYFPHGEPDIWRIHKP